MSAAITEHAGVKELEEKAHPDSSMQSSLPAGLKTALLSTTCHPAPLNSRHGCAFCSQSPRLLPRSGSSFTGSP